MVERCAAERIPDDIPALFARDIGDPDIEPAHVRNLSDGGACAFSDASVAVGAPIYVGFFVDGSGAAPVIARMRVCWSRPEGMGRLVGLAFLADGPAQRASVERMRDYVATLRARV